MQFLICEVNEKNALVDILFAFWSYVILFTYIIAIFFYRNCETERHILNLIMHIVFSAVNMPQEMEFF